MIKEALLILMCVIVAILIYALRQMVVGNKKSLDHFFRLRVLLSVLLMGIVIVAYYADWLAPSAYIQFL